MTSSHYRRPRDRPRVRGVAAAGNTDHMRTTFKPGDIIRGRTLRPIGDGAPVRIGSNRLRAQVLVVTHDRPCETCSDYLSSLGQAEALWAEKATVLALVGAGWEDGWSSPVPGVVADGALVEGLAPAATPVVAVVDRFGQLFTRVDAGDDHAFPSEDDVVGTLLDIAIRCPECGVPDVPSPAFIPEAGTRSGGMVLGQ